MASEPTPTSQEAHLALSPSLVSPSDVSHLIRELEKLEASLLQLKAREMSTKIELPTSTAHMQEMVEHNKLNLQHANDRQALMAFLVSIKKQAPLLHISFSTEPTPAFLAQLTAWLRHEINPTVLFTVGLQPAIGAGCMVRTTNKFFDLSLRQTFIQKRPLLLAQLIPPTVEVTAE